MCAARRLPARSAPGGRAQDLRNDRAAGSELEAVLRQPGGDALLKDLFRTQPDAAEVFAGHVERGLRNAATTQAASHQAKTLALSRAASLLSVERQHALERLADETFAAANRSAIPFTLDDDLSGLAMLHTDAQRHVIVERGIAFLMHGGGPRTIDGLLAQIDRIGRDSTEARAILARLPKMNIRRSELARIAPYAPDFARRHESRPVTRVALQLRIGDPQHNADFRANADMQARCASPAPPPVDALRIQALGEVVRAILAIPLVQSANELNF